MANVNIVQQSFTQKFTALIVLCALFASLFTALSVVSASPSQADNTVSCSSQGACISAAIKVVISGNSGGFGGGSAPTNVGSGEIVSPPDLPKVCAGDGSVTNNRCAPKYQYMSDWSDWGPNRTNAETYCPTKNVNGFDIKSSGFIINSSRILMGWNGADGNYYGVGSDMPATAFTGSVTPVYSPWAQSGSLVCVYPPPPVIKATNIVCILSYQGNIDRLPASYAGPARVATRSGTISSVESLKDNPSSCQTNLEAGLNYTPPPNQSAYGQYKSTISVDQVTCDIATTTFDGQSTDVIKCGNPYTVPGGTGYLTVWCDGYAKELLVKSWSAQDCLNGKNYQIGCSIPTSPTYNGFPAPVQAIRDGNDRTLRWGQPVANGALSTNTWRSNTSISSTSTPYDRNFSPDNKDKQLFVSDLPFGDASGQNLIQQLGFYQAGEVGSPFTVNRYYVYNGTFLANLTSISSVNLRTGEISVSNGSAIMPFVNEVCPTQSIKIDVIRSIGDATP